MRSLIFLISLLASVTYAGTEVSSYVCRDGNLGTVELTLQKKADGFSLYNYENQLIDQGLECRFSNDGKHMFLCSKKLSNSPITLVQYFSESHTIDSIGGGAARNTGFYRITWETDVKKDRTLVTNMYGTTETQCSSTSN